jgi:enoyl-CoA hydratase/carnithine racemase
MPYEHILFDVDDPVATITLNRPEALNAQNEAMRDGLVDAIERLESDDEILVAIVYGVGGRAFSAGADLKEGGQSPLPPRPEHEPRRSGWRHFEAFRWASKPIIAAIDGYCVGGGLELANYCDIRIATEASLLGQPEARTIGGATRPGLHQLPRAIPLGEALLVHLTSQPLTARRAYEIGLVQRLCPDVESLLAEANAIADQMIECNPTSLRLVKRVVRWGADMTFEQSEKLSLLVEEATALTRAGDGGWQRPGIGQRRSNIVAD